MARRCRSHASLAAAVGAIAVVVYVAVSSTVNGATSGYGTPLAVYVVSAAMIFVACAAALAEYKHSRSATWLFGVGVVIGMLVWPFLAAAVLMGVGLILALFERRPKAS